jgi:hypothetical protein
MEKKLIKNGGEEEKRIVVLRRVEPVLDGLLCNSAARTRARRSTRRSPRHCSGQPCKTRRASEGVYEL